MTHVVRTERAMIEDVRRRAVRSAPRAAADLAAQMAAINMTRSETEDRKIQLQSASRASARPRLLEVREERVAYEATVREMESAATSMEALIQRLEDRTPCAQHGPPDDAGAFAADGRCRCRGRWRGAC